MNLLNCKIVEHNIQQRKEVRGKKERKKETLKTHRNSNDDTAGTVENISIR
jgi:hypothetical protein